MIPHDKTVGAVIQTELWTVTPDTGVVSAGRLATNEHVRHLLVLADGVLVGMVSARRLSAARPRQLVGEVMSSPVLSITPDTTVGDALAIMSQNSVGFLPVIADKFLVGFVTDRQLSGAHAPDTIEFENTRQPD